MITHFNNVLDELDSIKVRLEKAHHQEVRGLVHEIRYLQHLHATSLSDEKQATASSGLASFGASEASFGGRVSQHSSVGSRKSIRRSVASLASVQEEDEEASTEEEEQLKPDVTSVEQGAASSISSTAPAQEHVEGGAASVRRSKPLGRPPRGASSQAEPKADESGVPVGKVKNSNGLLCLPGDKGRESSSQASKTLSTNSMAAIRVRNQQRLREAAAQAGISSEVSPSHTNTSNEQPPFLHFSHSNSHEVDPPDNYLDMDLHDTFEVLGAGSYDSLSRSEIPHWLQASGLFHPKAPWNIDIPKVSHHATSVRTFRSLWVNKVPKMRMSQQLAKSLTPQGSHHSLLSAASMVINPFSDKRLLWDLCGLTLVAYDCIFIPLQLLEVEELVAELTWASRIFWTLDIFVQCFTAVIVEQRIIVEFQEITRHYAKTWMAFDIVVVLVDWLTLAAESDDVGGAADALRTLRILRFIRLLRLVRIKRVWAELIARINNAATILMIGIIRHIIVLVIANHIIACLWYGVGRASKSWNYEENFHGKTVLYKYLSALHWSLTQFHGSADINPSNEPERGFAVCVVLVALIGFSSFLSSTTNMMMQLQQLKSERTRLQQMLCLYLKERKISPQLSARVKKHSEANIIFEKKREAVFNAVSLLPRHLLMDLFEEARSPVLSKHVFLHNMIFVYPRMVRDICYLAAEEVLMDQQDIIFAVSDTCTSMLHVKSGMLQYHVERVSETVAWRSKESDGLDSAAGSAAISTVSSMNSRLTSPMRISSRGKGHGRSSQVSSLARGMIGQDVRPRTSHASWASGFSSELPMMPHQVVNKGQWISEAIMWTHWEYCGELHCVSPGELIALQAEKFGNVVRRYDDAVLHVARYAQDFVEKLNKSKQCTDVQGPVMGKKERKSRMSRASRASKGNSRVQHDANHIIQTLTSEEDESMADRFKHFVNRVMPSKH